MDDESTDWERGPGRRTKGALIETYVEYDAIDRPCPPKSAGGCGASPDEFCVNPVTGSERKIPCLVRQKPAKASRLDSAAADVAAVVVAVEKARGWAGD